MSSGRRGDPDDLKPLQAAAVAACALGLATACGFTPPPRHYPPPPAPALEAGPLELAFGDVTVGTRSAAQEVTVYYVNGPQLRVPRFELGLVAGSAYTAASRCEAAPPQAYCTVAVVFAPGGAGAATEFLTVRDLGGSGEVLRVRLDGFGVAPVVSPK